MERFHVAEPAAGQACPFCAQDLGGSPLIGHYRAYFSYAYTELKTAVAEELATVERLHGGEAAAGFERAVSDGGERRDRTRVEWGRSVSVRVDLGSTSLMKKKRKSIQQIYTN